MKIVAMSFRRKTILGIATIQVVLLLILVGAGLGFMHQGSEQELIKHASTLATARQWGIGITAMGMGLVVLLSLVLGTWLTRQLQADLERRKKMGEALRQEKQQQKELIRKLEQAHNQLLQSEKLASIGQLAAGVAHEINNPVGYISSNLGTLEEYQQDLFQVLDVYESLESLLQHEEGALQRIHEAKQAVRLDHLRQDVPDLLAESQQGVTRVRQIVENLKDFSHTDEGEWAPADLQQGLESTLNIVNNEIKYKAEVVREYGELPSVMCQAPQLNQVFMNLLVNAAHAIEEQGVITLRTGSEQGWVWVEVSDTGQGIAPEHLKHIFDPFFTTKPVGSGTGLGLSLSYGIVQAHGGRIEVDSEPGQGTTFRVWLPVAGDRKQAVGIDG